jgi:hypothetical protein
MVKNVTLISTMCGVLMSQVAKALISQARQPALVQSGLSDLYLCATLAGPRWGEKVGKNIPRLGRRRSRLDPRTPSSEMTVASPAGVCLLA